MDVGRFSDPPNMHTKYHKYRFEGVRYETPRHQNSIFEICIESQGYRQIFSLNSICRGF